MIQLLLDVWCLLHSHVVGIRQALQYLVALDLGMF